MPNSQTIVTVLANGTTDRKSYDANGQLSFEQLDFTDGRHEQKSFLISGAAYSSTDSFFDAQWRITAQTQFKVDGAILDVMARSYEIDGSITTTHTDGSGARVSKEVKKPDGTDIQTTYNITGKPYVTQEATLDASWRISKLVLFNSNGTLYGSQVYTYAVNGDVDVVYFDGTGAKFLEQIDRADGTHVQISKAQDGSPYASQQNEFDSGWNLTRQVHFTLSGAVLETLDFMKDAQGTVITTVTNASGVVASIDKLFLDKHHELSTFGVVGRTYTSSVQTFTADWQLTAQSLFGTTGALLESDTYQYSPSGQLIFTQADFADGHHVQTNHDILDQAYTQSVMVFDASWRLTSMVLTKADGSLYADVWVNLQQNGLKELCYYDAAGQLFLDSFEQKDGSYLAFAPKTGGLGQAYTPEAAALITGTGLAANVDTLNSSDSHDSRWTAICDLFNGPCQGLPDRPSDQAAHQTALFSAATLVVPASNSGWL